jgi:hypothetical protein
MLLAKVWLAEMAKLAASPNVPAQTNYLFPALATELWTIQSEDRHVVRFPLKRMNCAGDYKRFYCGVRRPAVAVV